MKRQKRQSNHRSYLALACLLWTALLLTVYALAADSDDSQTVNLTFANAAATVPTTVDVRTGKKDGCTGPSYTPHTATVVVKNNTDSNAIVSFDWEVSGDSFTVDGTSTKVTSGTYSRALAKGESVSVTAKSSASEDASAMVTCRNFRLVENASRALTFNAATGGTITVAGETVTGTKTVNATYTEGVAVTATASSGYTFFGWVDTDHNLLSSVANTTFQPTADATISPLFVANSSTQTYWGVGSKIYDSLTTALSTASSGDSKKVVLLRNGTLTSGTYTITSGVTLLIPFDAAGTVYTNSPDVVYGSHTNPSPYRTLTMASGASIVADTGAIISVPCKVSATGTNAGSWNGTPTGPYGKIDMKAGSAITLDSGSCLYCYGYITGAGTVTTKSGAQVWEDFQLRCWRGGTATTDAVWRSNRVFVMNQYYVQNIEAPLTLESGASEYVFTAVNMNNTSYATSSVFMGKTSGMFHIQSGSVTKKLDVSRDYLNIEVNGKVEIASFTITIKVGSLLVGDVKLETGDYVLPIQSNIAIKIASGSTVNTVTGQDLCFLPGSELTIESGASFNVGGKVYIYDQSEWGYYAISAAQYYVPVGYTATNGTTSKRPTNVTTKPVSAMIDVNGEISVSGKFYTTRTGADIKSSEGTGKVTFTRAAGTSTATTYQCTVSGSGPTAVSIECNNAWLHNGDGSYTATAGASANTTYYYCTACKSSGVWETEHVEQKLYNVTISWPELAFTYTRSTSTTYTWDGEGKKYESGTSDSGSWTDNSKNIKVLNTSSAGDVNAQFNFTAQTDLHWTEAPSMAFTCGEATVTAPIPVPVTTDDEGTTVTATLSGTPAAGFTEGQIGTITVTITAAQGG